MRTYEVAFADNCVIDEHFEEGEGADGSSTHAERRSRRRRRAALLGSAFRSLRGSFDGKDFANVQLRWSLEHSFARPPRRGASPPRALARRLAFVFCDALRRWWQPAAGAEAPKRVVALFPGHVLLASSYLMGRSLDENLKRGAEQVELFAEFLDIGRFPSAQHERGLVRMLRDKYERLPPDLLIVFLAWTRCASSHAIETSCFPACRWSSRACRRAA